MYGSLYFYFEDITRISAPFQVVALFLFAMSIFTTADHTSAHYNNLLIK